MEAGAGTMRQFDTGATRNQDAQRIDPEGFLSPMVLLRFSEYMNRNRLQADGTIRSSDNWQKGIPQEAYMKSLVRHMLELWTFARQGSSEESLTIEDTLCALIFNAQGMLYERLRERHWTPES